MPELQPKNIQKELEEGWLWPVYWFYGEEKMKIRELLKRIQKTISGDTSLHRESFEGSSASALEIVESAQNLSLLSGIQFLVISEAEDLKDLDSLEPLLGERQSRDKIPWVCVFIAKDLDRRRKFTKLLLQKAAVVPCSPIREADREAWVVFLAKRKNLEVTPAQIAQLRILEPWSLDLIDQELEKLSLAQGAGLEDPSLVFQSSIGSSTQGDTFLGAFFSKKRAPALEQVEGLSSEPDVTIPFIGLLNWNLRQLILMKTPRLQKTQNLNPYHQERLQRWSHEWSTRDLQHLQDALVEIDYSLKQTRLLPVGLLTQLVLRFCH